MPKSIDEINQQQKIAEQIKQRESEKKNREDLQKKFEELKTTGVIKAEEQFTDFDEQTINDVYQTYTTEKQQNHQDWLSSLTPEEVKSLPILLEKGLTWDQISELKKNNKLTNYISKSPDQRKLNTENYATLSEQQEQIPVKEGLLEKPADIKNTKVTEKSWKGWKNKIINGFKDIGKFGLQSFNFNKRETKNWKERMGKWTKNGANVVFYGAMALAIVGSGGLTAAAGTLAYGVGSKFLMGGVMGVGMNQVTQADSVKDFIKQNKDKKWFKWGEAAMAVAGTGVAAYFMADKIGDGWQNLFGDGVDVDANVNNNNEPFGPEKPETPEVIASKGIDTSRYNTEDATGSMYNPETGELTVKGVTFDDATLTKLAENDINVEEMDLTVDQNGQMIVEDADSKLLIDKNGEVYKLSELQADPARVADLSEKIQSGEIVPGSEEWLNSEYSLPEKTVAFAQNAIQNGDLSTEDAIKLFSIYENPNQAFVEFINGANVSPEAYNSFVSEVAADSILGKIDLSGQVENVSQNVDFAKDVQEIVGLHEDIGSTINAENFDINPENRAAFFDDLEELKAKLEPEDFKQAMAKMGSANPDTGEIAFGNGSVMNIGPNGEYIIKDVGGEAYVGGVTDNNSAFAFAKANDSTRFFRVLDTADSARFEDKALYYDQATPSADSAGQAPTGAEAPTELEQQIKEEIDSGEKTLEEGAEELSEAQDQSYTLFNDRGIGVNGEDKSVTTQAEAPGKIARGESERFNSGENDLGGLSKEEARDNNFYDRRGDQPQNYQPYNENQGAPREYISRNPGFETVSMNTSELNQVGSLLKNVYKWENYRSWGDVRNDLGGIQQTVDGTLSDAQADKLVYEINQKLEAATDEIEKNGARTPEFTYKVANNGNRGIDVLRVPVEKPEVNVDTDTVEVDINNNDNPSTANTPVNETRQTETSGTNNQNEATPPPANNKPETNDLRDKFAGRFSR